MDKRYIHKIIGTPKLVLIDRGPVEYRSVDGNDTRLKFSEVAYKKEKEFPKELQFRFPDTIAEFYLQFGQDSPFFRWQLYNPQFPLNPNRLIEGNGSCSLNTYFNCATSNHHVVSVLTMILRKVGHSAAKLRTIRANAKRVEINRRVAYELTK
jgi:hypothetical protein